MSRHTRGGPTGASIVRFCVVGLLFSLFSAGTAGAEVTSVSIDSAKPYEGARGYVYVDATMNGTVTRDDGSVGEYSVPLVLKYPLDGGNGIAVVDWVTSARLQNHGWHQDEFLIDQLLLTTAGDYLFEQGYTYAAVQWGKSITEVFGPTPPDDGRPYNHLAYGTIERGADAFEILRDAARFLKDPSTLEGGSGPSPVEVVLSSGYSQTGALQMAFLSQGENVRDGELVYDGHLIAKMGLICPQLDDVPPDFGLIPQPCTANPNGDGSKVIHIAAQGDVEFAFMAALTRFPDDPNWRQYELAGVAHIPPSIIDLGGNQNPIESAPVVRGALRSLDLWTTQGIPAPPSRFLAGPIDDEGNLQTELDTDGNALGGLRLPHMEQVIDGRPAGAPLGTYTGINPSAEPPYGPFGGTFSPFDDQELSERYPAHGEYVDRVTRAADRLLAEGYIVRADRDAYVSAAATSLIGKSPAAVLHQHTAARFGGRHDERKSTMARIQEPTMTRVVSRDGTEIAYFTSGEGPPLVLVHGGVGDHTRWSALLPYLEPYFTVHAMDRRGRGASGDHPDWALEREYEDIVAVVDDVAEDAGSSVAVYGHSGGGFLAFGAAALTSDIGRLVLYEGWPPVNPDAVAAPLELVERLEALLEEGEREAVVETLLREAVKMSEEELDAYRAHPSWPERVAAAHTLPRELRAFRETVFDPEQAAQVTVPTLLLEGSEGPNWQAETVAAALPDARVAILDGKGHTADIVAPELVAEHVLAFLRERP